MIAENTTKFAGDEDDVEIVADYADETVGIQKYLISSYGADYDIEGIVRKLNKGDIEVPEFQREFVWDQKRSSRFIESLLLGLPVPGIFLYRERGSYKQLVIDGQQRLKTLLFFYTNKFGESNSDFKLKGLETDFNGLAYQDLPPSDRRRLDNAIIHATIIQQDKPDDSGTSQYFIFERLNTGGVALNAQEIRSAIYGGEFNQLLVDLNDNSDWRELFGRKNKRKRDQELILRFLALCFRSNEYAPSMKAFLNKFMYQNRNLELYSEDQIRPLFENTVCTILNKIGSKAFKPTRAVNAALLDSLMVGIARRLKTGTIDSNIKEQYRNLRGNETFERLIADTTSAAENVRQRIQLATEAFSNVE